MANRRNTPQRNPTPTVSSITLQPSASLPIIRGTTRRYEVVLRDSTGERVFPEDLPVPSRPYLQQVILDPRHAELVSLDEDRLTFVLRCTTSDHMVASLLLAAGPEPAQPGEVARLAGGPVEFPALASFILDPEQPPLCICIDAGHGGKDPGVTVIENGATIHESELNQRMANLIHDEIMKIDGFRPFLLKATVSPQGTDSYAFDRNRRTDLRKRTELCGEKGCNGFFVSIHHNASRGPNARGTEVYYFDPDKRLSEDPPPEERAFILDHREALRAKRGTSRACAEILSKRITDAFKAFDETWRDRGAKANDFTVIERGPADVPAVLVELGFLTSDGDRTVLTNDHAQRAVARAIAECICECCGENQEHELPALAGSTT